MKLTAKDQLKQFTEKLTEKDPRNVRIRGAVAIEKYEEITLIELEEYDPSLAVDLLGEERYVKQRLGKIVAQAIRDNAQSGEWTIREC